MRSIHFDAIGWRARFDEGFDAVQVRRVGYGLAKAWSEFAPGATVLVGYDTRHNGFEYAWCLAEELAAFGLHAEVSSEPCPTPALGWAVARDEECVGGVMLTASGEPCEYGGILVRGADGGTPSASFLARAERSIPTELPLPSISPSVCSLIDAYCEALLSYIDRDAVKEAGLRVVADPLYGAGAGILTRVLRDAGCEVIPLHDEQREDFCGFHPRPSEPWVDECEQLVVGADAACGIVLDGDGDRFGIVDEQGHFVSHHDVVPLILEAVARRTGAKGRVVMSYAASRRIEQQAVLLGFEVKRVPVGFERAYEEIGEGDVVLACEEFAGVCVPSFLAERDGLLAALLLVESVAKSGQSLSALVEAEHKRLGAMSYAYREIRMDPGEIQTLRNILPGLNPRNVAGKVPVRVSHADGLRLRFEDGSWVLIRPSRIRPTVRAYCEAPNALERDALLRATIALACDKI